MNVTLCSAFRNASGYIPRYFEQIGALRDSLEARGDSLWLALGEGDSVDDTRRRLFDFAYDANLDGKILDVTHGGEDYGSIVHPERFANLAKIWNVIWARIPENADAVVFVEADLIWDEGTIVGLLACLDRMPAVAPMVLLEHSGWPDTTFYDVWAFRRHGKHFQPQPPYFTGWPACEPVQIDSAGSCLVMRGDLARQVTWPSEDVVVGVCRQIYERGGSVWLHPYLQVFHP